MAKTNVWMSVSDLMTGLMVIFLFIAIAYMARVQDDISDYKDTKEKIYNKLKDKFTDHEIANGTVSVSPDFSKPPLNFPPDNGRFPNLLN